MINKQNKLTLIMLYTFLLVGSILILLPLYITLITPFKTMAENSMSFFSLPKTFYLDNVKSVVTSPRYYIAFVNTVYVTVGTLTLGVLFHPMMSYAISRSIKTKRSYRLLYYFLLAGIFIPFQVKMMPLVIQMSRLGLLSTHGLIFVATGGSTCEAVFLYVGYLNSIPPAMEDAAYIDGASTRVTFYQIIFPLMKPIIVTIIIKNGLWMWNDFMMPLIILNRTWNNWTLTLFQYNFKSQYTTDYSLSFAAFLMSLFPVVIGYVFLQKHIIGGLTNGAIKN